MTAGVNDGCNQEENCKAKTYGDIEDNRRQEQTPETATLECESQVAGCQNIGRLKVRERFEEQIGYEASRRETLNNNSKIRA